MIWLFYAQMAMCVLGIIAEIARGLLLKKLKRIYFERGALSGALAVRMNPDLRSEQIITQATYLCEIHQARAADEAAVARENKTGSPRKDAEGA